MLRLFFYPSFQLAFRTGTFGAYAFMTLTLGVLWLGHLVLHDVFLSVFQCGMTLLIAYGAIGHLYFRKALQDAFVERQVEISQGVLLQRDSKVERDWFRRPHMRLTALFGENLNTIRVQTQSTVSGLVASSESIESDANKLATRAEEIAAMLEQTASGMEEFAATIERSAASCHSANKQTNEIQRLAEQSAQGVSVLVQKMQTSKEFTDRVQKVLASIDEIAVQINILALNASIEAARAGEQGRAFAVVATEVRKLAVRTSESTKKVNSALNVAAEITEAGVWLANDATAGMNEIKVVTEGYGKLIANIAMSANEQSAGVAQIKMAVEQMALLTQTNVSSVDELKSIASAMRSDADQFKNGVEKIANIDVVIQK